MADKKPDKKPETKPAETTAVAKQEDAGKLVVNAKTLADSPSQMTKFLTSTKVMEQVGLATGNPDMGKRMARLMVTAASKNPEIFQCSLVSLAGVMIESASLGVEIDDYQGHAYIVVFNNKQHDGSKMKEAQLMIGYKGMVKFAWESDKTKDVKAITVYENDQFDYTLGLKPDITHVPLKKGDRGKPAYFYALVFLTNGGVLWAEPISAEEVIGHAKRFSKRFKKGIPDHELIWYGKKTALRQTLKLAPMGEKGQRAVALDEMAYDGARQGLEDTHKSAMDQIEDNLDAAVASEEAHQDDVAQEGGTTDADFEEIDESDEESESEQTGDPEPQEGLPFGDDHDESGKDEKAPEKQKGRRSKSNLIQDAMRIIGELKSDDHIDEDKYHEWFDKVDAASENHSELTEILKELEAAQTAAKK